MYYITWRSLPGVVGCLICNNLLFTHLLCIYLYMCISIHLFIYISNCPHVCIYIHIYIYVYMRLKDFLHMYMDVCRYICHIYIHTYIYSLSSYIQLYKSIIQKTLSIMCCYFWSYWPLHPTIFCNDLVIKGLHTTV